MRKFLAIAATVLATSFSPAAHAQFATIDIANLVQSIMSVLKQYDQEIMMAEQLYNQAQQLEYEYRQLKSLMDGDVSGLWGTVRSAAANRLKYEISVRYLQGDVISAKSVAKAIYKQMAASGLSPDEWAAREAERNQAQEEGDGFLTDYQANVLDQVSKRYQAVRDLQSKITSTEGTHEAMQLMNSQMNVLVGTINQLLEHNTTVAQRSTLRDLERTGRDKGLQESTSEYRTLRKASQKASEELIRKMRSIK